MFNVPKRSCHFTSLHPCPQKGVGFAAGVDVPPNDVPARIDPACLSIDRSWEVDSGVHALAQEEAVTAVPVVSRKFPTTCSNGLTSQAWVRLLPGTSKDSKLPFTTR